MSNRIAEQVTSREVTVGTDWTTVGTFTLGGQHDQMDFTVASAAASAATLSGFRILTQSHPDAEFVGRFADANFDSADIATMHFASTTGPHELPADSAAEAWVSFGPVHAIRFQAKVAASTALITVAGTLAPGGMR